jgi:hypothetical protein
MGLRAGQNTQPFLLQTYRRDRGGGKFVLMKDLSVPIMVKGRHWAGLRLVIAWNTGWRPAAGPKRPSTALAHNRQACRGCRVQTTARRAWNVRRTRGIAK